MFITIGHKGEELEVISSESHRSRAIRAAKAMAGENFPEKFDSVRVYDLSKAITNVTSPRVLAGTAKTRAAKVKQKEKAEAKAAPPESPKENRQAAAKPKRKRARK